MLRNTKNSEITVLQDTNFEKTQKTLLPATVRECEHLQDGARCGVRGGDNSGPGHARNSLDQPFTQQHLREAGARQHPVKT